MAMTAMLGGLRIWRRISTAWDRLRGTSNNQVPAEGIPEQRDASRGRSLRRTVSVPSEGQFPEKPAERAAQAEVPAERSPRRRSISGTGTAVKTNSVDVANTSPFRVPGFFSKHLKGSIKRRKSRSKLDRNISFPLPSPNNAEDRPHEPYKLKESRAHESLLHQPATIETLDFGAEASVTLQQVHNSVLGGDFCFEAAVEKLGPLPHILEDITEALASPPPAELQIKSFPEHSSSPDVAGSVSSGLQKKTEDSTNGDINKLKSPTQENVDGDFSGKNLLLTPQASTQSVACSDEDEKVPLPVDIATLSPEEKTAAWVVNNGYYEDPAVKYKQEMVKVRERLSVSSHRLEECERRLLVQEQQLQKLLLEHNSKPKDNEERLCSQQEEKDNLMEIIINRLMAVEEELKKHRAEMQAVIDAEQKIIDAQVINGDEVIATGEADRVPRLGQHAPDERPDSGDGQLPLRKSKMEQSQGPAPSPFVTHHPVKISSLEDLMFQDCSSIVLELYFKVLF